MFSSPWSSIQLIWSLASHTCFYLREFFVCIFCDLCILWFWKCFPLFSYGNSSSKSIFQIHLRSIKWREVSFQKSCYNASFGMHYCKGFHWFYHAWIKFITPNTKVIPCLGELIRDHMRLKKEAYMNSWKLIRDLVNPYI